MNAPRPTSLAMALLCALACGCSAMFASFDWGGDEPKDFALAVSSGDTERAYQLLCPSTRFGIPYAAFRTAVEANPFLISAAGVSIDKYESGGGLAVIKKGWISSNAGVADAQFHLSKVDSAWCLTGVTIGGTPVLPAAGIASSAGAAGANAPDRAKIPASLQNDAYRLFGLSNPATRRYTFSIGGAPGAPGIQRSDLLSIESDSARFRIVRGGSLGAIGSLDVLLDASGIHLTGSSQGTLQGPTLLMPGHVEPGTTWQSDYTETPSSGGPATHYSGNNVAEARETIRTPAGEFDALRVSSTATIESGDSRGTIRTRAWYAEGIGSVRAESDSDIGGETTHLVTELVDKGS